MTVAETREEQNFDTTQWRQSLQDEIRNLGKDPFDAIRKLGTKSLFHYLVVVTLRPAFHAYKGDSARSEQVLNTVQEVAGPFAQPLLEDLKAGAHQQEEVLGSRIDERLSGSPEFCRAVERVMIETNVLPLVQNIFAGEEWLLRTLRHDLQQWHSQGLFQRLAITIPSEQYEAPLVSRGALTLEVRPSQPTIVAGEEFSLFVVIRNPYQVPTVVYTAETHIPVELVDMIDFRRRSRELERERISQLDNKELTSWRRTLLSNLYAWRDHRRLKREPGSRIAEAVGTEYKPELVAPEPSIGIDVGMQIGVVDGGVVTGVEIERIERLSQFSLDFPEQPSPEYLDRILWRIEAYKAGKIPVLLQPGDSVVKQFVFRTRRWLFFTPLAHSFQIQVRNMVDGQDHMDTIRYDLSIQATITATMVGAILGGTLGGIARILVNSATQPVWSSPLAQIGSLILAVIFSAVSVVSLARKTSVQQIVSIEDFWGGLFLGFLIGYLGQNFALGLISPQSTTAQP